MTEKTFQELVRSRHSCRAFLSKEAPTETIRSILEDAQYAPSNCNTQPWQVHIVSGQSKTELSAKLTEAHRSGNFTPDFTFDTAHFAGRYQERQFEQGKAYYEGLGILRDDKQGREAANFKNYTFYNAPHVALLFMPDVGDNVRVAGDIGMYGQTFLLSLTAHGLAGVPQTVLGFFADTIRGHLGVSAEYKLLFGISFGYEDRQAQASHISMGRDPIESSVIFHS